MELNLPEIEAKKILSDYSGANNYILQLKSTYSIYKSKITESVATLNNEARRRRRTDYKFPASPAGTDTLTGGQ